MALNMTNGNLSYQLSCLEWAESLEIVRSTTSSTSTILICIFNAILAIHSAVLNFLVVVLYFKDRRLQTTANFLISALAVSDVLVALLVQPVNIVIHVLKINGIYSCLSHVVSFSLNDFGVGLSCSTVYFTISFERLFAVRWPLKHRVIVTKSILKRIVFVQVTLCLLSISILSVHESPNLLLLFQSRALVFGTVFILIVYAYIFGVINKRSRTMAKYRATKNVSKNVLEKITESSESQDFRSGIHLSKNTSRNSVLQNNPLNNLSENSKREINCSSKKPRDVVKQKQSLLRIVSQYSNPLENLPRNSTNISLKSATDDSGLDENKIPEKKLQCPFKACAVFQKAMLKLEQELRVCKTMALVAGALVLCFLPRVVLIECATAGVIPMKTFYIYLLPWLDVLAFANSSLNPYIYFFHKKDITDGVRKIVFGNNQLRMQPTKLINRKDIKI